MSTASRQPKADTAAEGSTDIRRPPREFTPAEKQWLEENAEAIKSWNDWVAEHGLPLEKYRMF